MININVIKTFSSFWKKLTDDSILDFLSNVLAKIIMTKTIAWLKNSGHLNN